MEKESGNEHKLFELLTQIRGTESNRTKSFKDYVSDAWKILGLDEDPDLISLEALLIEAIECITIRKEAGSSKKRYRVAMRRRDVALLSFGLLNGFYHTEDDGTHHIASERYNLYLEDNNNIMLIEYGNEILPDKSNMDKLVAKTKGLFSKDDERCRKALAKCLSKKETCEKCFQEGKRNIKESTNNGKIMKELCLPMPIYTLDNPLLRESGTNNPLPENINPH